MKKLVRTSTIALSLDLLLKGQLEFLSHHYDIVAVSGEDQNLLNVREREKVRTHAIKMQRKIAPLDDFISLWKLYRFFKSEKPLIVHSITPKAGLLSMAAAKFAGVPVRMHTFTGLIFPAKRGIFRYILIFMDRILCKMATDVYPEGNGVREDLIRHKITDKPLRIIANGNINGIDSGYFDPGLFSDAEKKQLREHHGIAESDFVFIFVGRLVADKGINELVAAFRKVLQAHPGSILLLVGSPEREMSPLLKETEAEIAGNDRIVTAGFQTDVRPFFAVSDALAFPSYREGFPNVVLQAGAMGLPSVVTNISGCNEIIKDGVNGLIIPVRDVDALAGSMLSMIDDKNRFDAMRSASRAMITKRFEQQNVWRELLGEYNRLEKDRMSNV